MNFKLVVGWLYPELMSTYGDRGNIIVLTKRCEWRGIGVDIQMIDFKTVRKNIESCNVIFGGGSQDRQQGIVIDDLRTKKGPVLKELFEKGVPGLFVCGAPQLLGHYYMTGDGKVLEGLGIFDMESKHFGKSKPRCIGNTIAEIEAGFRVQGLGYRKTVVGFENHGGRTYLGAGVKPFAKVMKGCGNNGEDGTEGAVYKNCIACYSHGPFLPKNPHIADWLISKALEVKYKKKILLKQLDDALEWQAHEFML
ncbi:cobalamin biosynthesis protein CobQ [Candidatus Gottesmanbacteria bacterium]|nr:cobalamin biosynthesis protein CobQ [Candidatus Gottesmanbacteria bacterium]